MQHVMQEKRNKLPKHFLWSYLLLTDMKTNKCIQLQKKKIQMISFKDTKPFFHNTILNSFTGDLLLRLVSQKSIYVLHLYCFNLQLLSYPS